MAASKSRDFIIDTPLKKKQNLYSDQVHAVSKKELRFGFLDVES